MKFSEIFVPLSEGKTIVVHISFEDEDEFDLEITAHNDLYNTHIDDDSEDVLMAYDELEMLLNDNRLIFNIKED